MRRRDPARRRARRLLLLCTAMLALPACDRPARPRAILVSFDSFNTLRFRRTLDSSSIPAFTRLMRAGACAPYALTQWATQTPIAHAALWTGAFAHTNGVGRHEAALPESDWSWLDERPPASLYDAAHLAAEPIWVTAGRQGLSVFAHHPTHAPKPPAYRRLDPATPDSLLEALRAEAGATLALPDVRVMNGYNQRYPARVITARTHPPRPAPAWTGADTAVNALEIAWDAGPDSLFALVTDAGLIVSPVRDLGRGVSVAAAPARDFVAAGDTVTPAFAGPIVLDEGGTPVGVGVRLFELSPDARSYTLYQTGAEVVQSNHAGLTRDYVGATGGWIGNAYVPGLGPALGRGGDGSTEKRQLEVYAFLMRQWLRGTRWAWDLAPDLFIDYDPSGDSFDHDWYGWIAPERPAYDPGLAAHVQRVRAAGFALLDRHLDLLMRFALQDSATILFVTSDHGMRPVWRAVHPNAILARAGLLAIDEHGRIDLARTRALSPDGWGIVVNHASRRDGIVPGHEAAGVIEAARAALGNARAPDGAPLVERIYTQAELDSLFGSGPAANALYISWRPGLRGERDVPLDDAGTPEVLRDLPAPCGDHGATLPYEEGMAAFCAFGAPVPPGTLPIVRQIDVAPTIAEWLGIEPPRHARGRSVLRNVLGENGRYRE